MRRAGTDEIVLRVEQHDGGNSITARLADVGGRSTVESEPGEGTRVTLWAPR